MILFLTLSNTSGFTQSPYEWKTSIDRGIIIGGAAGLGVDYLAYRQLVPIFAGEYLDLRETDINQFDRFAIYLNSSSAGTRSDVGMLAPFIISGSAVLYFSYIENESSFWQQTLQLGTLLFETNLVSFTITDLTKNLVQRKRPYVYNPENQVNSDVFGISGRKSFFSGHTSFSAANSFFFAKVFSDFYPESKWKSVVWIFAAAIPAWTGVERVLAGKHFPTDVIAGYAVGALCGYFIPHLHVKKGGNQMQTSFIPMAGNGFVGFRVLAKL